MQSTLRCMRMQVDCERNNYATSFLELQEAKSALEFELSSLQNKMSGSKSCMERMLLDTHIESKKQQGKNMMTLSMVEITKKVAMDEKTALQNHVSCLQDQINRLAREAQVQLQKSQDKIECLMYQYERTKDAAECERTTMLSEIRQLTECMQTNMKLAQVEVAKAQEKGGSVECELDHLKRVSRVERCSHMRETVQLKDEIESLKLQSSRDVHDLQNIIDEELARLKEQALEDKESLHKVILELKKLKMATSRGQSSSYSELDLPHEGGMEEPNKLTISNLPQVSLITTHSLTK